MTLLSKKSTLLLLATQSCSSTGWETTRHKETSLALDFQLLPDPEYIQYVEVALQTPGSIDLSNLTFSTTDSSDDTGVVEVAIVNRPQESICPTDVSDPTCWIIDAGIGRIEITGHSDWCCLDRRANRIGLCRRGWNNNVFLDVPVGHRGQRGKTYQHASNVRAAIVFTTCNPVVGQTITIQGSVTVAYSGHEIPKHTALQVLPNDSGIYETLDWPISTTGGAVVHPPNNHNHSLTPHPSETNEQPVLNISKPSHPTDGSFPHPPKQQVKATTKTTPRVLPPILRSPAAYVVFVAGLVVMVWKKRGMGNKKPLFSLQGDVELLEL